MCFVSCHICNWDISTGKSVNFERSNVLDDDKKWILFTEAKTRDHRSILYYLHTNYHIFFWIPSNWFSLKGCWMSILITLVFCLKISISFTEILLPIILVKNHYKISVRMEITNSSYQSLCCIASKWSLERTERK